METVLHIKAAFKCVYLLNGAFVEKADSVRYRAGEPVYITALPLNAHHLPYTVKVFGGKALSNEHLANVYTLGGGRCFVKLSPRYNYVYSTNHRERPNTRDDIESFFLSVKRGDLAAARALLTKDLSASIDDGSLSAFFDEYTDIIEDKFTAHAEPNRYYLIDKNDCGAPFSFDLKDKLIDNITQI
jgi:hypothetical protein